jgi:radical SAM enzyme (TIGR01210 family)
VQTATVFLTGRECPWRCAMCDLWQYTTETDTPEGAIPVQVRHALGARPPGPDGRRWHVKLYNAGSFFDARAVPPTDYDAIAHAVAGASRVIVESHPSLIGRRVGRWQDALSAGSSGDTPILEVGMGLETAHPDALERLNKRMTTAMFAGAADRLRASGADLRVFLLIAPPFVPPAVQREWLDRSVDFAFACGATAVSLIPARGGNGTMEALASWHEFVRPTLDEVEDAMDAALARAAGRVFVDLWELDHLASCDACFAGRRARLSAMNLMQRPVPRLACPVCLRVEART